MEDTRSDYRVAQATRLCRWATRPAEWQRTFKLNCALPGFEHLSIPSGESPDGTGQWPVLPKRQLADVVQITASSVS